MSLELVPEDFSLFMNENAVVIEPAHFGYFAIGFHKDHIVKHLIERTDKHPKFNPETTGCNTFLNGVKPESGLVPFTGISNNQPYIKAIFFWTDQTGCVELLP